ncbi:MAG: SGNH/GDSL hydrolase family protein [Oscillospiraceae bacterium]|nr:SGNH/GDSL hydrolase family protein [Oscillospiraceae bacterium]
MKKICCLLLSLTLLIALFGCTKHAPIIHTLYDGTIETNTGVYITSSDLTLTFGEGTRICYDEGTIDVGGTTHDISRLLDGDDIYYDPRTGHISSFSNHGSIYLGTFHTPMYLSDLELPQEQLFIDQISLPTIKAMVGKKVVCLGDSMTEGIGTTKVYSEWFPTYCGFVRGTDQGLGGSCIAPKQDEIPTWEAGIASFYERYTLLEDDADVIIVFGGINDWTTGRELGAITDAGTDTFYGSMRALCGGLKEKYPDAQIFFFSSPQNNYIDRPADALEGTAWEGNTEGYNRKGYLLQDYADAMEEVCAELDVHYHSLTEAFPWGVEELGDNNGQAGTYGSDGLHPNAAGHALIAREMATFIQNVFAEDLT